MRLRPVTGRAGTARIVVAACLAPAAPALLFLVRGLAVDDDFAWWGFGLFVVPGYIAMLFVGIPVFLVARRKGWALNGWQCVGAGALSGVIAVLPVVALDLLFGANPLSARLAWSLAFLGIAVLAGAIAGLAFRMIAGPRISAAGSARRVE